MRSPLRSGSEEMRRFNDCTQSTRFPISHEADVGEVRRTMRRVALRAGFVEEDAERVAIVATESGNNIVRHAGEGEMVVSRVPCPDPAFEIIAIDRGPGIPNLRRALEDGHSTAGTSGVGFGAIQRQSDQFDAYSVPDQGTVVISRIVRSRGDLRERSGSVAGICLPKRGEEVSGDAWVCRGSGSAPRLMVADGLGHGYAAADASMAAIEKFRAASSLSILEMLEAIHDSLRSTRGAAVSIADIHEGRSVDYSGLGNVRGLLVSLEGTSELVGMNGTLGHRVGRMKVFSYDIGPEPIVIMHSDGLKTRWKLDDFRGLRIHHPAVIAGVLLRECERKTDDVCIVVWKGAES